MVRLERKWPIRFSPIRFVFGKFGNEVRASRAFSIVPSARMTTPFSGTGTDCSTPNCFKQHLGYDGATILLCGNESRHMHIAHDHEPLLHVIAARAYLRHTRCLHQQRHGAEFIDWEEPGKRRSALHRQRRFKFQKIAARCFRGFDKCSGNSLSGIAWRTGWAVMPSRSILRRAL